MCSVTRPALQIEKQKTLFIRAARVHLTASRLCPRTRTFRVTSFIPNGREDIFSDRDRRELNGRVRFLWAVKGAAGKVIHRSWLKLSSFSTSTTTCQAGREERNERRDGLIVPNVSRLGAVGTDTVGDDTSSVWVQSPCCCCSTGDWSGVVSSSQSQSVIPSDPDNGKHWSLGVGKG